MNRAIAALVAVLVFITGCDHSHKVKVITPGHVSFQDPNHGTSCQEDNPCWTPGRK